MAGLTQRCDRGPSAPWGLAAKIRNGRSAAGGTGKKTRVGDILDAYRPMKRALCFFSWLALNFPLVAQPITADLVKGLEVRNLSGIFTSGRIADIAVDPKNRSTWYIATASGGLWKTTNRGLNFQPIFEDQGSYSLGVVVVDPKNSDLVWLGTGENQAQRAIGYGDGVYKSTDAGRTWKKAGLPNSEHVAKIVIDPRNSNTVFVAAQGPLFSPGGDRGVYKTTDGGATWKAVLTVSENTGATDLDFDPRNPDVMYAATYQRRRNVSVIVAGGPESAIYKTTDAGAHWTKLQEGLPTADMGRIALAVSPQKPDTVYTLISLAHNMSYFYRSDDAGAHWTKTCDLVARAALQDPEYYGEIFADPFQYDRVWIMDTVVRVTPDGGKTITPAGFQVHADNHALVFDPADPNHFLEGNDGGLYESYDHGRSWRHFNNIPVTQFYRVSTDNGLPFYNIYGGSQDNGSQGVPSRTQNRVGIRASDWLNTGGGDGFQSRADYADPDTVYSCSQQINCVRLDLKTGVSQSIRPNFTSAEVGATSVPAGEGGRGGGGGGGGGGRGGRGLGLRDRWDIPFIISPHSHTRLYIFGNHLMRSDDRGDTWKMLSGDLTRNIDRETVPVMGKVWGPDAVGKNLFTDSYGTGTSIAESPLKEGLLILGTDDGLIQISEDSGATWRKIDKFPGIPDLTYVSGVFPSPHNVNTIFVTFNDFHRGNFKPYVLKTTDLGRTWHSVAGDLPDRDPVWNVIQDPENAELLFAGTEFGMSFSVDGGAHWVRIKGGMPTISIRALEIQRRESDLVAASFGRGFFVLDDISALRHLTPQTLAQEGTLFPVGRPARSFSEIGYYNAANEPTNPNPPAGALLTYYLRDNAQGDARVVITVTDSAGKQVRQIDAVNQAGLHRTPWDLREAGQGGRGRGGPPADDAAVEPPNGAAAAAQPAGRDGAGGGGGGRGGRGGPLVKPGTYTVQLGKQVNGTVTPLGEARKVEVVPLEPSNR
jgi:photosystem II stability/assembly factor-like uncharacterized protein